MDFRVKDRLFTGYLVDSYISRNDVSISCFSSYSLRSRTSFVLMSRREAHIYLWHGSKSSEDSRATAKAAAKQMLERYVGDHLSIDSN